jgi:hypothetical protein
MHENDAPIDHVARDKMDIWLRHKLESSLTSCLNSETRNIGDAALEFLDQLELKGMKLDWESKIDVVQAFLSAVQRGRLHPPNLCDIFEQDEAPKRGRLQ